MYPLYHTHPHWATSLFTTNNNNDALMANKEATSHSNLPGLNVSARDTPRETYPPISKEGTVCLDLPLTHLGTPCQVVPTINQLEVGANHLLASHFAVRNLNGSIKVVGTSTQVSDEVIPRGVVATTVCLIPLTDDDGVTHHF